MTLCTEPIVGMRCVLQAGMDIDGKPAWACMPFDDDGGGDGSAPVESHTVDGGQAADDGEELSRRDMLAATAAAAAAAVGVRPMQWASAADLSELQLRLAQAGDEGLPTYPILAAQSTVTKLLEDEETFRTMMKIGLPTGNLQMPPQIAFALFKKLEGRVSDPGAFMDAAIEYVEYSRDANDLVALARMSRTNGGGPAAVDDYVDRSMYAARGAAKALQRMVPLLPK